MLITAQTLKKRPPIRATPPAQRALITAQMQREGSSCKSPHRGQHHSAPQRTHRVDNQPLKGKPAVRVTGSPQTAPPTDRLAHTVLPTAYPTAHRLANRLSHGTPSCQPPIPRHTVLPTTYPTAQVRGQPMHHRVEKKWKEEEKPASQQICVRVALLSE
jgi:hypothetical protein